MVELLNWAALPQPASYNYRESGNIVNVKNTQSCEESLYSCEIPQNVRSLPKKLNYWFNSCTWRLFLSCLTFWQNFRSTDLPSLRTQSSIRVLIPSPHMAFALSWHVLHSVEKELIYLNSQLSAFWIQLWPVSGLYLSWTTFNSS